MERRELIIDAALRLASEEGLGALSVRSVALAADIGPTTLRHYFPNQALLYEALTSRIVTRALTDCDINDETRSPVARLHECLAQFLPEPEEQQLALGGWFELHRLALGPKANEGVRELVRVGRHRSATVVRGWLDRLAGEGHMLSDDADALTTRFLALVSGLQLALLLEPERNDLAGAVESLRWFAQQAVTAKG